MKAEDKTSNTCQVVHTCCESRNTQEQTPPFPYLFLFLEVSKQIILFQTAEDC